MAESSELVVERWRVTFGPRWAFVCRWDDDVVYRLGIERLKGELAGRVESTKAVDVIGVLDDHLCLLEAKDFRSRVTGSGIQPNSAAYGGRWKDLPLEFSLKIRDSLAGAIGAVETSSRPEWRAHVAPALSRRIKVLAFVQVEQRSSEPDSKRQARLSEFRSSLKQRISWLTRDVVVIAMGHGEQKLDISVESLPDEAR